MPGARSTSSGQGRAPRTAAVQQVPAPGAGAQPAARLQEPAGPAPPEPAPGSRGTTAVRLPGGKAGGSARPGSQPGPLPARHRRLPAQPLPGLGQGQGQGRTAGGLHLSTGKCERNGILIRSFCFPFVF